jgi:hypothetical protein
MRGEYLQQLLPMHDFLTINIDVPINETPRLLRSVGWRYKKGPLIRNINNYIRKALNGNYSYDLVWIDKGVFIDPEIIHTLKKNSGSWYISHLIPPSPITDRNYFMMRLVFTITASLLNLLK